VTLSLGLSSAEQGENKSQECELFLRAADQALYLAKARGRNRVEPTLEEAVAVRHNGESSKQTDQQARRDGLHARPTALIVAVELRLHLVPKLARNDCLMLTGMALALVADFTVIDTVAQNLVESTA
jgi:hypothetical protein